MPYFAGRLKEQNGEQEYSYDHIIEAENLEEAEKIYDMYAKDFYGDADERINFDGSVEEIEKEDGGYYFFNDAIFVEVESIRPTTKEEWMQEQFDLNLLKGGE